MHRLTCGDWQAQVYEEQGMNLTALSWREIPVFRTPNDLKTLKNDPFLYGNPLLFPANRTKNGRFSFKNREFSLPINEPAHNNNLHGQMIDAPFEVVRCTDREIVGIYRNRGERYPFAFDMTIADVISEMGWKRTITVAALEDMPYTLAFHTTFVQPQTFTVPLGDHVIWDEHYIPTGETEPPKPLSESISGYHRAAGLVVTVDDFVFTVSDHFDHWILYNGGGGKGFLCLEPQSGGVNGLNTGECRILKAGNKEEFSLTLRRKTL